MSFHLTAEGPYVEHGHILKAKLGNGNGEKRHAEIDLNKFIGNNNGKFEWGGHDFSKTAKDISFSIEGGASVPVLRATLNNLKGEGCAADINLAERISNNGGVFAFA